MFHNGVFGMFEDPRFEAGTKAFIAQLKRMKDAGLAVYVGGGEGGTALEKYGQPDWVTHCFTAGGTVLNALGAEPVPYLVALRAAAKGRLEPPIRPSGRGIACATGRASWKNGETLPLGQDRQKGPTIASPRDSTLTCCAVAERPCYGPPPIAESIAGPAVPATRCFVVSVSVSPRVPVYWSPSMKSLFAAVLSVGMLCMASSASAVRAVLTSAMYGGGCGCEAACGYDTAAARSACGCDRGCGITATAAASSAAIAVAVQPCCNLAAAATWAARRPPRAAAMSPLAAAPSCGCEKSCGCELAAATATACCKHRCHRGCACCGRRPTTRGCGCENTCGCDAPKACGCGA